MSFSAVFNDLYSLIVSTLESTVKMNKMIHKKTGASFLVVYVIYVSLVYTDSMKTASCYGLSTSSEFKNDFDKIR